jgi:hypothetical protein
VNVFHARLLPEIGPLQDGVHARQRQNQLTGDSMMAASYPFSVDGNEFQGKRVLVTGGTKGMGEAIVRRLTLGGGEVRPEFAPGHAGAPLRCHPSYRINSASAAALRLTLAYAAAKAALST